MALIGSAQVDATPSVELVNNGMFVNGIVFIGAETRFAKDSVDSSNASALVDATKLPLSISMSTFSVLWMTPAPVSSSIVSELTRLLIRSYCSFDNTKSLGSSDVAPTADARCC